MGPLHAALVKRHPCLLLFIKVLELSFKLIEELSPYDREVLVDMIQSVNPGAYVFNPSGDFISFDKGEGKGNFLDWRIKPSDVLVDAEISFNFFNEVVHFGAIACKDCWFLAHGSNVCCNWDRSLPLARWLRLGRRSCTTSTTASTTTTTSSSSSTTSVVGLTTEGGVELVDDFLWIIGTWSRCNVGGAGSWGAGGSLHWLRCMLGGCGDCSGLRHCNGRLFLSWKSLCVKDGSDQSRDSSEHQTQLQ